MHVTIKSGTQLETTLILEKVTPVKRHVYWDLQCGCTTLFKAKEIWMRKRLNQGKSIECRRCRERGSGLASKRWYVVNKEIPAYARRVVPPPEVLRELFPSPSLFCPETLKEE